MNQCTKNCIFSRIYQFLWNFVLAKIYPPQVVGYKCKIGGILSFVNGHHVSFWAKVFMSFCNFWAFVAYRYGGEVFSIHIKRKLQEQDNMNLMQVTFRKKSKECLHFHHVLISEIFAKLHSFRDNLFQGKQREVVNTKGYSERIYFNF